MRDYCVDRLCEENVILFNNVVENYPNFKFLLYPFKLKKYPELFENRDIVMNELLNNDKLLNVIRENVQIKNTPLEDLEKLDNLVKDSEEYDKLYSKVISVGEYDMIDN
jgi:hypothetical protein